jgi:hypothetical protein
VRNPVAKVEAAAHYDRLGNIGFCFGRAALAHYLLLQNGVRPEHIAKIFIVGNLKYGSQIWEFHEATMVTGERGMWWVIDPLFEKMLSHVQWMERAKQFDVKSLEPQLRFYVTDARKFQPSFGMYRTDYFLQPELRRYFSALVRSLGK